MSLPTSTQPCASGRHPSHVVTLVDELTARCAPACEAARWGRLCHHVKAARNTPVRVVRVTVPRPLDLDREFEAIAMEAAFAVAMGGDR